MFFSLGYALFSNSESKLLFYGLSAVLFGISYMARPKDMQPSKISLPLLNYSEEVLKLRESISKILSTVEQRWDSFMEIQQKEVFLVIEHEDKLDKEQKYQKTSTIYLFRKIDFPLRSLMDKFKVLDTKSNKCNDELPHIINETKKSLILAVNTAVDEQIILYKNLTN